MKVAAGRVFFEHFGAAAQEIVPDLGWVLVQPTGQTWVCLPCSSNSR